MDDITLNALNESIAHWQRYADGLGEGEGEPVTTNCSLCGLFYMNDCVGCPVRNSTGRINCRLTPYGDAYDAYTRFGPQSQKFIEAAKIELEFLKSLLPVDNTIPV